jgi:hypothetical protein
VQHKYDYYRRFNLFLSNYYANESNVDSLTTREWEGFKDNIACLYYCPKPNKEAKKSNRKNKLILIIT